MKKIKAVILVAIMFLSLTSLSKAAHREREFYGTAVVAPVVCGNAAAGTVLYQKPYYYDYYGYSYSRHRYYKPYNRAHKYYRSNYRGQRRYRSQCGYYKHPFRQVTMY